MNSTIKECSIGAVFLSDQLLNPIVAWAGRITCIETVERGFKFRREHPYYNGETFVLDQAALDKSFWIPAHGEPSSPARVELWGSRVPGSILPDWRALSGEPQSEPGREAVRVIVESVEVR
jgi:hypothetical protein